MAHFHPQYSFSNRSPTLWYKLESLTRKLREDAGNDVPRMRPVRDSAVEVIKYLIQKAYDCVSRDDDLLRIEIMNRNEWVNVDFDEIKGVHVCQKPTKFVSIGQEKQARLLALLVRILELFNTNNFVTKRQLYYEMQEMFPKQSMVDELVDDICCITRFKRYQLHIYPSSKGLLAGSLLIHMNGQIINVSSLQNGFSIPTNLNDIDLCSSDARFILLVEKESIFSRLLSAGICQKLPVILITGKGYPDANTREMVNILWHFLQLPILALVDADPFGIDILCVYKYGSLSLAYMSDVCVTRHIHWLGIHPTDIIRFPIPKHKKVALTESDRAKIYDLSIRPYFSRNKDHEWSKQLNLLNLLKVKVELECFSSFNVGDDYLADVFIPQRIKHGSWI